MLRDHHGFNSGAEKGRGSNKSESRFIRSDTYLLGGWLKFGELRSIRLSWEIRNNDGNRGFSIRGLSFREGEEVVPVIYEELPDFLPPPT